jgi:outer membrane protein OmpA-like peptidoglycan-associated protein
MLDGERGFGHGSEEFTGPVQVSAQDDSFVVVLSGDVLFDFDKAVLKPQADAVLQQAASTIKAKSGPRLRAILINGHTDGIGDGAYNERLSERRAKAVADWFVNRRLLAQSTIRTQGFGKTQPRVPNTTPANRAKNRRVEIYLLNS